MKMLIITIEREFHEDESFDYHPMINLIEDTLGENGYTDFCIIASVKEVEEE
jgi:hypothetical protein